MMYEQEIAIKDEQGASEKQAIMKIEKARRGLKKKIK